MEAFMKVREITELLNREIPPSYAESWDHVGLLVGDEEQKVHKILVALDADDAAVTRAAEEHFDLIVTHHPLLFHPMERVVEQDFIGRRVRKMIRNGISYFAMHTNFDIVKMADINAEDLKLKDAEVLDEVGTNAHGVYGFGRIGSLEEDTTLENFAEFVKTVCHLPFIRTYGDPKRKIHLAAVASGSGRSSIPAAIAKDADVIVTGDVDYHTAIDANAKGIAVIDAGHYGTEFCFIPYMTKELKRQFPSLTVAGQPIRQPYQVL